MVLKNQTEKSEEKDTQKPIKSMKNRVKMRTNSFNHSVSIIREII